MRARKEFEGFRRQRGLGRKVFSHRKVSWMAMQYAIEHCNDFETRDDLEFAIKHHLVSGQNIQDEEYGSVLLSFVIQPIVAFIITRIAEWVWNRYKNASDDTTQTLSPQT